MFSRFARRRLARPDPATQPRRHPADEFLHPLHPLHVDYMESRARSFAPSEEAESGRVETERLRRAGKPR